MNWEPLFDELIRADSETQVTELLKRHSLLGLNEWKPLGGEENNFSIVGNQHTDPTGALVEKVINSIDAVLMAAAFSSGVDPEGAHAPASMAAAVEQFFGVKDGRLGALDNKKRTALAQNIQLVAAGSKENPSYLIVDRGEGQTPASFPSTFLSLAKSNKLRIPFVQGKFNSGGTGVLQFCGDENFQLIASKRHPDAPVAPGDTTRALWGFTLIRRIRPTEGDKRRSSMYVYLAPKGEIPSFSAEHIGVLPGTATKNGSPDAYKEPLQHGSVVKLYNYRWKARSIATTEARFELEKYLHSPSLPFRITETREYRANYYSTTVSGVWASINSEADDEDNQRVEEGFPAQATLNLESVGALNYRIAVFTPEVSTRRVPHGVFFAINGQVHGALPADFVARKLDFEYLNGYLLVSVDCTGMLAPVREDFFMASRDRIRQNEAYDEILARLESDLKNHPGLKALNALRRARALEKALGDQDDVVQTFQDLLKMDPTLRALFNLGDRLMTRVGPTESAKFDGRRFPTYFRIMGDPKGEVLKQCAVNRTCRIEFETDAANDYFDRADSPGEIIVRPLPTLEYNHLWNGVYSTRFRPPRSAKPGDRVSVSLTVTDPDRASRSKAQFDCQFTLAIGAADHTPARPPGKPPKPPGPSDGNRERSGLAVPNIIEVRQAQWADHTPPFDEYEALRVKSGGEGQYDYFVNLDNAYLLTELRNTKEQEKLLVVYWFKWGLVFCAMGMLQHAKRLAAASGPVAATGDGATPDRDVLQVINDSSRGVASTIVPVIRNLRKGPPVG